MQGDNEHQINRRRRNSYLSFNLMVSLRPFCYYFFKIYFCFTPTDILRSSLSLGMCFVIEIIKQAYLPRISVLQPDKGREDD